MQPFSHVAVHTALCLTLLAGVAGAIEAPPDVVRGGRSADDMLAARRALRAQIDGERPSGPAASVHVALTPEERASLHDRPVGAGGAPMKIGIVRTLSPGLTIAGRGSYVAITADGASGIRVRLTSVNLPQDLELYFLSEDGDEAYGPYTGRGRNGDGDFWTPSIRGSAAGLLLRQTGSAHGANRRGGLVLAAVGYLEGGVSAIEQAGTSFCGNPDCIVDASCTSDPAVAGAANAVAQLEWVSGAFLYTCTGGLLADTDAATQIPYMLTANHCLSRSKDAQSLEAFFFYRTAECGDSCPSNDGFPKTVGATIKATGTAGDFTLLQLTQMPPAGTVMLGWNTTPVAFTNGLDLYRISHPNFGPQTYSQHRVDTAAATCRSWPRGQRIYSRDLVGATDGGSSGSPVVNESGQVVGQLSGGCGTNVGDVCDTVSNATVDGALAYYFASVAPYLNPTTSCVPATEVCSDGIDNDCDGAIDCADSNCTGSPSCTGTCAPLGSICTANSQCCSQNCKGKLGQKTCK